MQGLGHLGVLSYSLLIFAGNFPTCHNRTLLQHAVLYKGAGQLSGVGKSRVRATSANVPTPATLAAQAEPAAGTHSARCWVSHTPYKVSLGPLGPELLLLLLLSCLQSWGACLIRKPCACPGATTQAPGQYETGKPT